MDNSEFYQHFSRIETILRNRFPQFDNEKNFNQLVNKLKQSKLIDKKTFIELKNMCYIRNTVTNPSSPSKHETIQIDPNLPKIIEKYLGASQNE